MHYIDWMIFDRCYERLWTAKVGSVYQFVRILCHRSSNSSTTCFLFQPGCSSKILHLDSNMYLNAYIKTCHNGSAQQSLSRGSQLWKNPYEEEKIHNSSFFWMKRCGMVFMSNEACFLKNYPRCCVPWKNSLANMLHPTLTCTSINWCTLFNSFLLHLSMWWEYLMLCTHVIEQFSHTCHTLKYVIGSHFEASLGAKGVTIKSFEFTGIYTLKHHILVSLEKIFDDVYKYDWTMSHSELLYVHIGSQWWVT